MTNETACLRIAEHLCYCPHSTPDDVSVGFRVLRIARENRQLREALAAYRSALRSGEPESESLRAVGERALAAGTGS